MDKQEVSESLRLQEAHGQGIPWRKWGPYLSERQWGTVREDYSDDGNAWNYFSHDQSRSRAYRWGEDGLAGFSDDKQYLCFALALWNGKDPIIKERLFGLTNSEGNHGEDVKEYYFYLDSTPTHSYMKYLYKYPQAAYPYDDLVRTNKSRSRDDLEYELLDTGIFNENRYFDVFVEYAKASPEDILIRITAFNRGPDPARLRLLPTLWFRNTWSWKEGAPRSCLTQVDNEPGARMIRSVHDVLGEYWWCCEGDPPILFTQNETNNERLFGLPNRTPYVKDGINNYVVHGQARAISPHGEGTKAAADYSFEVAPGAAATCRLYLTRQRSGHPFSSFDEIMATRQAEADAFYESITPPSLTTDQQLVMRQALAGMLWSKQYYYFDLDSWLDDHEANPLSGGRRLNYRNHNWFHMENDDVISMPDKWEYPWYAAWDLAFHTTALNMVDPDFARRQLDLMLTDLYLHPNGQLPAYEWNFSDVNPPVHAWATLFSYSISHQREDASESDVDFLEGSFRKLLLNFTWWVNRKDPEGKNVFEGGFLGLDNIGVFDRSAKLPHGGSLEQADGTAWMALFSQNMLEIAAELSLRRPGYESMVLKFIEHFFWIAGAMDRVGLHEDELWDEEDGFFYDVLRMPDGTGKRIKVRSLVGLLPLCATTVLSSQLIDRFPNVFDRVVRFISRNPELVANIHPPTRMGMKGRRMLAILNENKLRCVLTRMLDEERFLSPHGIRSLSRWHKDHPFTLQVGSDEYRVEYLPAESNTGMFGGNSNWRGPVWVPVNVLIIRALLQFHLFYGDEFKIACPTGSGNMMTLFEVSHELASRLASIFLRDENGRRPVFGGSGIFQNDPFWRDNLLFYEYFHGDNGAGIGASHQTGWTGVVARLIQLFGYLRPEDLMAEGTRPTTLTFRRASSTGPS